MNIVEAIRSRKRFRRPGYTDYIEYMDLVEELQRNINVYNICEWLFFYDNWELEEESITIPTKEVK